MLHAWPCPVGKKVVICKYIYRSIWNKCNINVMWTGCICRWLLPSGRCCQVVWINWEEVKKVWKIVVSLLRVHDSTRTTWFWLSFSSPVYGDTWRPWAVTTPSLLSAAHSKSCDSRSPGWQKRKKKRKKRQTFKCSAAYFRWKSTNPSVAR